PVRFAERVRAEVAARWGVDPARVRLEWGPAPAGHAPADTSSASLVGTGAGGVWIVDVDGGRARLSLRAGTVVQRAVARRPLARGATLTADDIALDSVVVWGEPGAEPTSAVQPGWVVNRPLRAGEPLAPPAVAAPAVVRAGQRVRVAYVAGAIRLTLDAVAAGTAALGQPVAVRTAEGRRLEGVAVGDAEVRIDATPGRNP
ncbi:MAG: flagellar basal body P-ring formation protein FlgA, partial [Gemmatimonadetes bacterium]|nr:flagellar basal body P-ring formation protein FlgA [Gemmatimonadota bacterium]